MTTLKVECACGQRYAFDVEPVYGRMPAPVSCPACGADGTAAANAILAKTFVPQPAIATSPPRAAQPVPMAAAHIPTAQPIPVALPVAPPPQVTVAPSAGAIRLAGVPPPVAVAAPLAAPPFAPPPLPPVARGPFGPIPASRAAQKPQRGKDGWDKDETGLNKLGTYVVGLPAVFAALLTSGFFGIEVPWPILAIIVGGCGVAGGILNLLGRGPLWAGMIIGPVLAFGGFGAVSYWLHGRHRAYKFELMIAFLVGCLPGMGLQWLLQRLIRKFSAKRAEQRT